MGSEMCIRDRPKSSIEVVGLAEMAIQRSAIELGQHIHLVDAGVDAIADWNINQAVFARQRHCWLGSHLCEWLETGACPSPENDCQYSLHAAPAFRLCGGELTGFLAFKTNPWARWWRLQEINLARELQIPNQKFFQRPEEPVVARCVAVRCGAESQGCAGSS